MEITTTKTGFNIQHTTREVWGVDDDESIASPAPASVTHDALGIKGLTVGTPEQFLAAAQEAQTTFWDALSALESILGVDVDGTRDLADLTIEDLKNEDGE